MKSAVIDIGSNSVRLLMPKDNQSITKKELISTRLADGLINTGKLNGDAMARTADVVAFFYSKAKECGYENIFVFATAAVRNAENGKAFCDILRRIDIDVDVLSGETEAELGFLGALRNSAQDCIVFDIGGASTEIMKGERGKLYYKKSIPLGMVVLSDISGTDKQKMEETVKKYLTHFSGAVSPDNRLPLYGIGGTATSLAALCQNLKIYDVHKTHNYFVSSKRLNELEEIIFSGCGLESQKIVDRFPSIPASRACIIGHGIIMTKYILKLFNAPGFTALETDNMEGYLQKFNLF